jgi:hypothetical protein
MRHILLCRTGGQSLVSRSELRSVPEVSSSMTTRAAAAHVCRLRLIIFSFRSRSRYFEANVSEIIQTSLPSDRCRYTFEMMMTRY